MIKLKIKKKKKGNNGEIKGMRIWYYWGWWSGEREWKLIDGSDDKFGVMCSEEKSGLGMFWWGVL